MSPRRGTDRGQDSLEAITEIQSFTPDMDFGTFEIDAKTIKAGPPGFHHHRRDGPLHSG